MRILNNIVFIIWLTKPLFLTFLSFFLISQLLAEFSFYVTGFYKHIADSLSILETFFLVLVSFISSTWIHSLASPTFLFVESFIIFAYKPVKFSSDVEPCRLKADGLGSFGVIVLPYFAAFFWFLIFSSHIFYLRGLSLCFT